MAEPTLPTTLTNQLSSQVDFRIRRRGETYFREGAVHELAGDASKAQAAVVGSRRYRVELRHNPGESVLLARCDCPYNEDRSELCKHVWAVLLAAETRGLLRSAAVDRSLKLVRDEHEIDDSDIELDDDATFTPSRFVKSRQVTPWRQRLAALQRAAQSHTPKPEDIWPADRQIIYVIDISRTVERDRLIVEVATRRPKRDGGWSKLTSRGIARRVIDQLPDEADRQIVALLLPPREDVGLAYQFDPENADAGSTPRRFLLTAATQAVLVKMMCQTGRCNLRTGENESGDLDLLPLRWDDAGAWELRLKAAEKESGDVEITGALHRGEQTLTLDKPRLIVAGGLVFHEDTVAPLKDDGAFRWIGTLRDQGPITVPAADRPGLMENLLSQPALPPIEVPADLSVEQVTLRPRVHLRIKRAENIAVSGELVGTLSFDYEGVLIPSTFANRGIYKPDQKRFIVRDRAFEQSAAALMLDVGFRTAPAARFNGPVILQIPERHLSRAVLTLSNAGWVVEAEGKTFRSGGAVKVEVVSGVDWFELHGEVSFGDQRASLPELLTALRRGQNAVRLDDGTFGLLPQEWLERYAPLMDLGDAQDTHLRFNRSQIMLLDAMLASQPEATFDEQFAKARRELCRFDGVESADPPAGFIGELRPYQREGLGWLHFLRRFGFGGCLADDMGLGKTIQVLAMLEARRAERVAATADGKKASGPSLVVVPRSLVFNWKQEAAKFTPQLRVLDHTGIERMKNTARFGEFDLVLTTYGTLRRDAAMLTEFTFDYVILDEAQAIKNPSTASAKAARLLKAEHRLALSGTPVENHLGELWSMLEFLNPGLRGGASLTRLAAGADVSDAARQLLARAVRPFILRRTKQQVASDLPPKVEQTIYCELDDEQRRLYDELRDHFRRSLLPKIDAHGLSASKMQVLEALLRLRQAACHPGLIDKTRTAQRSAKLDTLVSQVTEVVDEGHKVLIFSQFTSLLAILRDRLATVPELTNYEYIDGKTRDRAERVEHFQTDPNCKLFLISLKAGGVGLNLTAADYVFLLDPWWNPAVEAQAIDRTHRIGQSRHVFAYRLIAKDTVEEKVLQLQDSKRQLADAIINEDNSVLKQLDRQTLELLLS